MPTVPVIEIKPMSDRHTPDILLFMRFVKV